MTDIDKMMYAGAGAKVCIETMLDQLANSGTWCDIPEVAQFIKVYAEENVNEPHRTEILKRLEEIQNG